MNKVFGLILVVGSISMVVLLCFFSCYISSKADEFWKEVKKEKEKRDERR